MRQDDNPLRAIAAGFVLAVVGLLSVAACGLPGMLPPASDATPSASPPVVDQPSISPSPNRVASTSPVPTPAATPIALPAWTPPPGPPTMLPEDVDPPHLITSEAIEPIVAEIMERLLAAYAGSPHGLEELFTPAALAGALASDELLASIRTGEQRVLMDHDIVGVNEIATRYMPDGQPIRTSLEIMIDVPAGARRVDAAGAILREWDEPRRLLFELTAAWDGLHDRWQVDELRSPALGTPEHLPGGTPATRSSCPWRPADIPSVEGFQPSTDRAWCDALGRLILPTHLVFIAEASDHCGWRAASLLYLGPQPGWEIDIYDVHNFVRDPTGLFEDAWLSPYEELAALPAGAIDTGLTNGNVRLYYLPAEYETAIYADVGGVIERWPRLTEAAGCA